MLNGLIPVPPCWLVMVQKIDNALLTFLFHSMAWSISVFQDMLLHPNFSCSKLPIAIVLEFPKNPEPWKEILLPPSFFPHTKTFYVHFLINMHFPVVYGKEHWPFYHTYIYQDVSSLPPQAINWSYLWFIVSFFLLPNLPLRFLFLLLLWYHHYHHQKWFSQKLLQRLMFQFTLHLPLAMFALPYQGKVMIAYLYYTLSASYYMFCIICNVSQY